MFKLFLKILFVYLFLLFGSLIVNGQRYRPLPIIKNFTLSQLHIGCILFKKWRYEGENRTAVQYLLLRSAHNHRQWVLPKGRIKANIGLAKKLVAARILRIKLGLQFTDINFVPDFKITKPFSFRGIPKIGTYYVAELINCLPDFLHRLPWYYQKYRWLTYNLACSKLPFDDQRNILTQCHKHLLKINVTI